MLGVGGEDVMSGAGRAAAATAGDLAEVVELPGMAALGAGAVVVG